MGRAKSLKMMKDAAYSKALRDTFQELIDLKKVIGDSDMRKVLSNSQYVSGKLGEKTDANLKVMTAAMRKVPHNRKSIEIEDLLRTAALLSFEANKLRLELERSLGLMGD